MNVSSIVGGTELTRLGCSCFRLDLNTRPVRDRFGRRPLEQREKSLHAIYELSRLPPTRIPALGLHVIPLLSQKRQTLPHVFPGIGVLAARLRQHSRVFEMPESNVVRGEGKPRAIR